MEMRRQMIAIVHADRSARGRRRLGPTLTWAPSTPGNAFNRLSGSPLRCRVPEVAVRDSPSGFDARPRLREKRTESRETRQQQSLQIIFVGRIKEHRSSATVPRNHHRTRASCLVQVGAQLRFDAVGITRRRVPDCGRVHAWLGAAGAQEAQIGTHRQLEKVRPQKPRREE